MTSDELKKKLLEASRAAYNLGTEQSIAVDGFAVVESIDIGATGLKVVIYESVNASGTKDFIIAFAGTENLQDAAADINLGLSQWSEDVRNRITSFVRDNAAYGRIHFTGHSLGGALAQYAAYDAKVASRNEAFDLDLSLTTFNALGGEAGLQQRLGDAYDPSILDAEAANGDVAHYFVDGDLISRLGDGHLGGNTYRLANVGGLALVDVFPNLSPITGTAPFNLFTAHTLDTLDALVAADGFQEDAAATPDYLAIADLQVLASAIAQFGEVANLDSAGEAAHRIAAAFGGTVALAGTADGQALAGEWNTLLQAIARNISDSIGIDATAVSPPLLAVKTFFLFLSTVSYESLVNLPGLQNYLGDLAVENLLEAILIDEFDTTTGTVGDTGARNSAELILQSLQRRGFDLADAREPLRKHLEERFAEGHYFQQEGAANFNVSMEDILLLGDSGGIGSAIFGRVGGSELIGGDGRDILIGAQGAETLRGGAGADFLYGERDADQLFGGDGDDELHGGGDEDLLVGDAGADQLYGGPGGDSLDGGDGPDRLYGGRGSDFLRGGAGDDLLDGGSGDGTDDAASDLLDGGLGFDEYRPGAGDRIQDSDGYGQIRHGEEIIGGLFTAIAENTYRNDARGDIASLGDADGDGIEDDLTVTAGDSQFSILDYDRARGTLGITLLEAEPAATVERPLSFSGTDDNETILAAPDTLTRGNGGQDYLIGTATDEALDGGSGDDLLHGGGGNDFITGGPGRDVLYGEPGADYVEGGADDDVASGQEGDDYLDGGGGTDVIGGGSGSDVLVGGEGADLLHGDLSFDVLLDSTVFADPTASFGEDAWGVSLVLGAFGAPVDQVFNHINAFMDAGGAPGQDVLFGGAGDDRLLGGGGADRLFGEAGNDSLEGEAGADELDGGPGDDLLIGDGPGDAGDDILRGGAGADELQGGAGADALYGDAGADRLFGGIGDDRLSGGEDADVLLGGDGADVVHGDGGDDVLSGEAGADQLWGDAGDDDLRGGDGDDVYHLRPGDGHDIVADGAGTNRIVFHGGVTMLDVVPALATDAAGAEPAVVLRYGAGDSVTFVRAQMAAVEFGDGTRFDADKVLAQGLANHYQAARPQAVLSGTADAEVLAAPIGGAVLAGAGDDRLEGSEGDDILLGGSGDDTLLGAAGADLLLGGPGDDSYHLDAGSGTDSIHDRSGINEVLFGPGAKPEKVRITHDLTAGKDEWRIGYSADPQDIVRLAGSDLGQFRFRFADAPEEALSMDDLSMRCGDGVSIVGDASRGIVGTRGPDIIDANGAPDVYGGDGDDRIEGGPGDTEMVGGYGADTLRGGPGNDVLYGDFTEVRSVTSGEADVLEGGPGDDYLVGGGGADRYVFTAGDGQDVIFNFNHHWFGNSPDVLAFADGITPESIAVTLLPLAEPLSIRLEDADYVPPVRVSYGAQGDAVELIGYNPAEYVPSIYGYSVLYGYLYESLPELAFADGAREPLYFRGTHGTGTDADEIFLGTPGSDSVDAGAGNDTLLGSFAAGVTFVGGTDRLTGGPGDDVIQARGELRGGAGNDRITGSGVIDAGSGDDIVISTADTTHVVGPDYGADSLLNLAGTDRIEFQAGITPADISGARDGSDLLVAAGAGTTLRLRDWYERALVSRFVFATGEDFGAAEFEGLVLTGEPVAQNAAPVLAQTLPDVRAEEGYDFAIDVSAETFVDPNPWDSLQVHFTQGDGSALPDWISLEEDGGWTLSGTPMAAQVGSYTIAVTATDTFGASVATSFLLTVDPVAPLIGTPYGDLLQGGRADDQVEGLEGDDFLYGNEGDDRLAGGPGNDWLRGGGGDDVLAGGPGSDYLLGGEGDDRYLIDATDSGIDLIGEPFSAPVLDPGTDTVVIEGMAPDEITYLYAPTEDLAYGGGIGLRWKDGSSGLDIRTTGIEHFTIGDTELSSAEVLGRIERSLYPDFEYSDYRRNPLGGVDLSATSSVGSFLYGSELADNLSGGGGDDILFGFGGDDTLCGAVGADYLNGGEGNDRYGFDLGDGRDVIQETGGAADALVLGSGLSLGDVACVAAGDDLIVQLGATDAITIRDWYVADTRHVENLAFADGSRASLEELAPDPHVNQPPLAAGALPDQQAFESQLFAFEVPAETFFDPDPGDMLVYSASLVDGAPLPGWVSFDPTERRFTGTPGAEDAGTWELSVQAADEEGLTASASFELEVRSVLAVDGDGGKLAGSSEDDVLLGSEGDDRLRGGSGDDIFLVGDAAGGADDIAGGQGEDRILGTDGDDIIRVHRFGGQHSVEVIDGGAGFDVLAGTPGRDRLDLSATELRSIELIDAGAGDDRIEGSAGADVIAGGAGNDRLRGGLGDDTYRFARGDGADRIFDAGSDAGGDVLQFTAGVDPLDVAFVRHGGDLELSLAGSDDSVRIEKWYQDTAHRLETLRAGDGSVLLDSRVESLIQAMAGFAAERGADGWEQAAMQAPDEALALVAAFWQPASA